MYFFLIKKAKEFYKTKKNMYNCFQNSFVWHSHTNLIWETCVLDTCKEGNEQGLTFYITYFFSAPILSDKHLLIFYQNKINFLLRHEKLKEKQNHSCFYHS